MNFKEWLALDEVRFKGFERQFKQAHPEIPRYASKQIYNSILQPSVSNYVTKQGQYRSPTIYGQETPDSTVTTVGQTAPFTSPSAMMANSHLVNNVTWTKRPMIVNVSPQDFMQNTLFNFLKWKFGVKADNKLVQNDQQRFDVQRNKLGSEPGRNEPVVLIKNGDKYELVDGYHRIMPRLLKFSAPPQHQQYILNGGNVEMLDLSKWRPIPVDAYIGIRATPQNN